TGASPRPAAPAATCGRGRPFSPPAWVATALGACMLTIMGLVAERHAIDLTGATVRVEKHMTADPVRRIAALPVTISVPGRLADADRVRLENAAKTCPVHASLGDTIDRPIRFVWAGSDID
ncbi:MAG: OsmC family protein, partial [Planctomycetes bacterium]|nr:OsmC family protein [Planctomycetota bacterium]